MSIKINNEEYPECFFRNIFDGLCAEYQSTSFEKKKEILNMLVENKYPLKIVVLKMYEACQEANKDIKFTHIVFGLADLLEEYVKKCNKNDKN